MVAQPLIILASQSAARKRLLKRLGFRFRAIPAYLDEDSYSTKSPRDLVRTLAREKARFVSEKHPEAIVIGSDQVLVLGKKIFGKPHTVANAVAQLSACSGKTVQLLTAVTVVFPVSPTSNIPIASFLNVTKLKFHKLTAKEITDYVALDQPFECAGSFMIEKNGLRLFETIETDDATAIEGLPCLELNRVLRHAFDA